MLDEAPQRRYWWTISRDARRLNVAVGEEALKRGGSDHNWLLPLEASRDVALGCRASNRRLWRRQIQGRVTGV